MPAMVEWRYCRTCAERHYSALLTLLREEKDCPHYDADADNDEEDARDAYFCAIGLETYVSVCEECVPTVDDTETTDAERALDAS